jgi:hypothetical protein
VEKDPLNYRAASQLAKVERRLVTAFPPVAAALALASCVIAIRIVVGGFRHRGLFVDSRVGIGAGLLSLTLAIIYLGRRRPDMRKGAAIVIACLAACVVAVHAVMPGLS